MVEIVSIEKYSQYVVGGLPHRGNEDFIIMSMLINCT